MLAEQETHLNMTADDRQTWEVFTDDPVMIARLDKISDAIKTVGEGKTYRLRADQVLLRKGKRSVSDAQRKKLAERMKRLHRQGVL